MSMFGERIKELREEKKLTQGQLAQLLQCNQQAVSRYELEKTDISTQVLIRLCTIFGVTADYILGIEDETGAKVYR